MGALAVLGQMLYRCLQQVKEEHSDEEPEAEQSA